MKIFRFAMLFAVLACIHLVSNGQKIKGLKMPKGFVFIPQGNIVINRDTISVNSFYMYSTEIKNIDYREFIVDLSKQGKINELAIAMVDTLKWRSKNSYNEPYVSYYFRHPAYNNYPVVNITYEAVLIYCNWLSEKLNILNQGKFDIKVRLPYRSEWVYAASNGGTSSPYSWDGPYVRNSKGCYLCNFQKVGEENICQNKDKNGISIAEKSNSINVIDITAPAGSYYPNKFGLYNINGNVAEMVYEKGVAVGGSWKSYGYEVRNESVENFNEASTHIGFRPVVTVSLKTNNQ